jgi:hypothetical protein
MGRLHGNDLGRGRKHFPLGPGVCCAWLAVNLNSCLTTAFNGRRAAPLLGVVAIVDEGLMAFDVDNLTDEGA